MTVTRPARLTGAALAAVLALVPFVWILCDLAALGSPGDLLRYWAGDRFRLTRVRASTTLLDPLLCLAAAVTALAALRSRHAAAALAATGAVTLAVRLPGLWTHGTGPLVTALTELALAAGLLVTALAGRRPPTEPDERTPTRPRTGPAVTAGVLLAVAALVLLAREAELAGRAAPGTAVDRFTGGRSVPGAALGVPPGWLAAVLAGLCLAAAVSAFATARHTRPLGLLAGGLLCATGLAETVRTARLHLHHDVWYVTAPQLDRPGLAAALYGVLAGAAVLALLAGRGAPDAAPAPKAPAATPPPPYPRPPGW
ncbi:hypothetical protein [Streptomyces sp. CC208A]|uniref:hypothetical protein n=1 Tax=Streptomyces sp. CC208A TaxID=3044573 RepID=UPI0024A8B52A|nr:hypothetical protein [Streptomyces sp. CC208A]